jgi:hypothetical protein
MFCLVSDGGGAAGPVRVHAHLSPCHRVPLRYDGQGARYIQRRGPARHLKLHRIVTFTVHCKVQYAGRAGGICCSSHEAYTGENLFGELALLCVDTDLVWMDRVRGGRKKFIRLSSATPTCHRGRDCVSFLV